MQDEFNSERTVAAVYASTASYVSNDDFNNREFFGSHRVCYFSALIGLTVCGRRRFMVCHTVSDRR